MIVIATGEHYTSLLRARAPEPYGLAGSAIAPPEILMMLAEVSAQIERDFSPASWLIVEQGAVVGLCSIKRVPENGVVEIGYGIAPCCWNRGIATRGVGEIVAWALADHRVHALIAETLPGSGASQQVLSRNGFVPTGERFDAEDGLVVGWRRDTI